MKIAIGADHRGCEAAQRLIEGLQEAGHEVQAMSDLACERADYPDGAWAVGKAVAEGRADRGLLLCGSGIGMSIAANKVEGVRAALVADELAAEASRAHNNANVLCLSADMLEARELRKIVDVWLAAEFEGGRHERRVRKITAIETGRNPETVQD